ncbi:hypothetical protein DICVIV_10507 [Dictyocaulus viviparus]|uniref:DNA polymerase zeta catalytic subunit N-terminal domain-containing protein n=1 Tax=Dictyocaulus viviparus TaxID=29172 RepID=A0A0D8XFU4_DICVI|nr:hypothetical protein DICVIV_10507 [Dictyocaulus viviparus]
MVDVPSFQLRNILCEYSLSPPCAINRFIYPNIRQQIPTLHIFGTTPSGKKACVHVHGVLPYLLLRIGSEYTTRLDQLMRDRINRLIQRELTQNKEETTRQNDFVQRIEPVMGRVFLPRVSYPQPLRFLQKILDNSIE